MLALVAVLLAVQSPAVAQVVAWQLPPTDYTQMTRFGHDLYQVKGANGKVGLIHSDGAVVVPVEADKIGMFYEGTALVTVAESATQNRVLGILTEDGQYTPFSDKYFTLNGQEFYSDDVLTVQNAKGKKGYIDKSGEPVCGFDRDYYRIKPFTEGYAAISDKGSSYYLINKRGERQSLMLPIVGNLAIVYNPIQGKSLALDDYKNCYKFTLSSGECEDLHQKVKQPPTTDFLFRPESVLKNNGEEVHKTAPFTKLAAGSFGLSPTKQGDKYGFQLGGQNVLPGQLGSATTFEDNLSIVTLNGKTGLLRLFPDQQPVSVSVAQTDYNFDAGSTVDCRFAVNVPAAWSGKSMDVSVKSLSDKSTVVPSVSGQDYTIELQPQRSTKAEYAVTVSSEGLQLWSGQIAYMLKRNVVDLQISGLQLDDKITDENYKVTGSFVLYNPNEGEIETELSISHSDLITSVGGFPQKVSVKPEERKRVTFFIVTSDKRGTWEHTITVKASKGGSSTLTAEVEAF